MAPMVAVWKSAGRRPDAVCFGVGHIFPYGKTTPLRLHASTSSSTTTRNTASKHEQLQIGVWCCTSCCCKSTGAMVRCTRTECDTRAVRRARSDVASQEHRGHPSLPPLFVGRLLLRDYSCTTSSRRRPVSVYGKAADERAPCGVSSLPLRVLNTTCPAVIWPGTWDAQFKYQYPRPAHRTLTAIQGAIGSAAPEQLVPPTLHEAALATKVELPASPCAACTPHPYHPPHSLVR